MSNTKAEHRDHVVSDNRQLRRILIPLSLSVFMTSIQALTSASGTIFERLFTRSSGDHFIANLTLLFLISLLLEVTQKWSREERIIKLTQHIRTDSDLFVDLDSTVVAFDTAVDKAEVLTERLKVLGQNPILSELRKRLSAVGREFEELGLLRITTGKDDNGYSVKLVESVRRLRAVSPQSSDEPFWTSQPGRKYWQANLRNPGLLSDQEGEGIWRIFLLTAHPSDAFKEEIRTQFTHGVKVGLLKISASEEEDFAIFGEIAVRTTLREKKIGQEDNQYSFSETDIKSKTADFEKLWQRSTQIVDYFELSRAEFTTQHLNEILNAIGL